MELFSEVSKYISDDCYFGSKEKIIQFYDENNKYFCFYVDFFVIIRL